MSAVAGITEKPTFELVESLKLEVDRYERILGMTTTLLEPVLLNVDSPEAAPSAPEELPMHDLHAVILRLSKINNRFEGMRSTIRL
jgi:hypothetical protein